MEEVIGGRKLRIQLATLELEYLRKYGTPYSRIDLSLIGSLLYRRAEFPGVFSIPPGIYTPQGKSRLPSSTVAHNSRGRTRRPNAQITIIVRRVISSDFH